MGQETYQNRAILDNLTGKLEFDFNTLGQSGLGKKWFDESFTKWEDEIESVGATYGLDPKYPGGKSRGLKQIHDYLDANPGASTLDAIKNTSLYGYCTEKGYSVVNVLNDTDIPNGIIFEITQ